MFIVLSLLLFGNGCHLKLCDFGTCRKLETNLLYTASIGTVRYMAPEVIQGTWICVCMHRRWIGCVGGWGICETSAALLMNCYL